MILGVGSGPRSLRVTWEFGKNADDSACPPQCSGAGAWAFGSNKPPGGSDARQDLGPSVLEQTDKPLSPDSSYSEPVGLPKTRD